MTRIRFCLWARAALLAAVLSAWLAAPASADPFTPTFTTAGATTGTGPWTMTSTDVTFSILRFVPLAPGQVIQFQDWTSLVADYNAVLGGIGAGAPRFVFVLDFDNNGSVDGTFDLHWGPAGTLADPTLGPGNTGNLLALTDVGRYDLTGVGGSVYTDRAAALALAGTYYVLRASLVLDSFGGNDRNFTINSITGTGNFASMAQPIPEPGSALLVAGAALGFAVWRRRRRSA